MPEVGAAQAAELAGRLAVPFDGVCLACLSFVASAVSALEAAREAEPAVDARIDDAERDVRVWVRRMTPDLWNDGLDEVVVRVVGGAAGGGDELAAAALVDLEREGSRSAVARAFVLDLGSRLAAREREAL